MCNLMVDPREAVRPFSGAVALRAVDELLVMCRLVVSDHIHFAGELSAGSAVPV
jgi:hypothetical protein